MSRDKLELLWDAIYDTFYDTYYEEVLSDSVISSLELFDKFCKIFIAVTTSGSTIAGFTIWSKPGWQVPWIMLCGITAFAAILHNSFDISNKLKEQNQINKIFTRLRVDFETFRYKLDFIGTDVSDEVMNQFKEEFFILRERFAKNTELLQREVFITNRLKNKAQNDLDKKLAEFDLIEENNS